MLTLAATTTPTAATHSDLLVDFLVGLLPVAVLVLVIGTAGYLTLCWLFPFTHCFHDYAFHRRVCRRCQGTGIRLRAGRRLINHVRSTRRRYHR